MSLIKEQHIRDGAGIEMTSAEMKLEAAVHPWNGVVRESQEFAETYQDRAAIVQKLGLMAITRVSFDDIDSLGLIGNAHRMVVDSKRDLQEHTIRKCVKQREGWWLVLDDHPLITENPFTHAITEQYAVGVNRPETMIYNFGDELTKSEQEGIAATFQWFLDHTQMQSDDLAKTIVIARNTFKDTAAHKLPLNLGVAAMYFDRESLIMLDNMYSRIKNKAEITSGSSVLHASSVLGFEAVLTHELAHALDHAMPELLTAYMVQTGWVVDRYNTMPGYTDNGATEYEYFGDENCPTQYAEHSPMEDFAESCTLYRFRPELLDDTRRTFFDNALNKGTRLHGYASQLVKLETPLYPQATIPSQIYVARRPKKVRVSRY